MNPSTALRQLFDIPDRREAGRAEFAVQPNSQPAKPTTEAYAPWQEAFRFFNNRLFCSKLADSVITLTWHTRARGYFCAGAFQDRDGAVAYEIAMNPSWFEACGDASALSIFVHEMCHQWRHDHGPLNRKGGKGGKGAGGYHDSVWADKMEAIGLMPSNTGEPGGKRLGFQMTHYIIEGGAFDRACREFLADGHFIDWRFGLIRRPPSLIVTGGAEEPAKASRNTRTKFVCPVCDLRAWARSSARLSCIDCDKPLSAS